MPFAKQRNKKFKLRTVVCGKAPRETTKIIIISETIFYSALINKLTYFFRCFHCCRSSCRMQSGNMNLQSSTFKQPKYRRAWSSIISMILFRALTHIHRRIAHVFRIFNRGIFSLSLSVFTSHTCEYLLKQQQCMHSENRIDGTEHASELNSEHTSKVREYNCSIIKTDFTDLNQKHSHTLVSVSAKPNRTELNERLETWHSENEDEDD